MAVPNYKCKFDVLSRPDSSVLLSEDETAVMAGVYGPVEVKSQKVLIDKAQVEAHFRPKTGLPSIQDRQYESIIRNICETEIVAALYPRSSVVVVIQEMQNSGMLISCAINATCLALLNSGIDMKYMFAAVTCFLTQDESLELVPPINQENVKATFVFVFDSANLFVIGSHVEGRFSEKQYEEALNVCRLQSNNVFKFFKNVIQEQLKLS